VSIISRQSGEEKKYGTRNRPERTRPWWERRRTWERRRRRSSSSRGGGGGFFCDTGAEW